MKIKHLLLASTALLIGFSACNKSDGPDGPTGPYSAYLKFDFGAESRAIADPVTDGTEATLANGALFFAGSDGTIYRRVEISDNGIAGSVSAQDLADGKLFEDINENAKHVYVFGNHDFEAATSTYTNISDVAKEEVTVLSQTDNLYGVTKVNLYGEGPIMPAGTYTQTSVTLGAEREANFQVTPIAARLEIEQLIGTGDIKSFKVEGIYIHYFYEKMRADAKLALTPNDTPWKVSTNNQDYQKYLRAPGGDYLATWYEYLFDDGWDGSASLGLGTSDLSGVVEAVPNTSKVWAYNVLANAGSDPHIVIHLSSVVLDDNSNLGATPGSSPNLYKNTKTGTNGDAYLTIVGYKDAGGNVSVTGGNIYKMKNLRFGDSDLGETPYPGDDLKEVYVEVQIKPWEVIPVTPIFN